MNDSQSIKDQFRIESHVASTRSADLYRVIEIASEEQKLLWTLRYPIVQGQTNLGRLKKLQALNLPETPLEDAGIDKNGTLYAVLPRMDLIPLLKKSDAKEAERRFLRCLRTFSRLHDEGIQSGDIGSASFWCDRRGEIYFLGVLGAHDGFATGTAVLPPLETLQFMAPEQRTGGESTEAADVFALGVLGYELFTHSAPWKDTGTHGAAPVPELPSTRKPGLPLWVDEVLTTALQARPDRRYPDASAMLKAIDTIRRGEQVQNELPAKTGKVGKAGTVLEQLQVQQVKNKDVTSTADVNTARKSPLSKQAILIAGLGVIALVGGGTYFLMQDASLTPSRGGPVSADPLLQHREATTDLRMKLAIDSLSEKSQSIEKRIEGIRGLVDSDDPLTHEVLLSSAIGATSQDQRVASEQAIIARMQRLGFVRTAEQLKAWLQKTSYPEIPERYETIVRTGNPLISANDAAGLLTTVYSADAPFALKLTVARGLDSRAPGEYEPVLRAFFGDKRGLGEPSIGTWATLVLEDPELAALYGEDALLAIGKADEKSLLQLLEVLAERDDLLLQQVSKALAAKNVLPPGRNGIARFLGEREDLPGALQAVLARMILGKTTPQDILLFSQWVDPESERVLFSLAANADTAEQATEAVELLAGRTLKHKKIGNLLERIRSAHWEKRSTVAKSIGVLALPDQVDAGEITAAVKPFKSLIEDKKVLNALINLDDERILDAVLKQFPDKVGIGTLLKLLDNKNPKIRMTAIKSLKAFNDVGALKLILEYYDREKDEDVRRVYQDTFWTLADKK